MERSKEPCYDVVPVEEQQSYTGYVYDSGQYYGMFGNATPQNYTTVDDAAPNQLQPQPLNHSRLKRALRMAFDLVVAAVALLFTVFGIWVFKLDGSRASPGSAGVKLFEISQYGPTIFPVLFAAVVGGSLKSIASWRIQTSRGATIGLVEQCLGSQTILRAFTTQVSLRAFNLLGILIVIIWCLSPLGSQASLRVISVTSSYPSNLTHFTSLNTFSEYQFGYAEGISEAVTTVANPIITSLMAATLLGNRNQDLWGNIRLPAIERLENGTSTDWMDVPDSDNLTYASLVGTPVATLPSLGNTSFTLPGSYLSVSCLDFGPSNQTELTNYTGPGVPPPDNGPDCSWASSNGGSQYQIAVSMPCATFNANMTSGGTRNARKLVWESMSANEVFSRAECQLTTTYVDTNVTCTGSSSGSTCHPSSVRRSLTPSFDSNWTVLDIGFRFDAESVIDLLTGLFPDAQLSGGQQPVVTYFVDPYHAVVNVDSGTDDQPTYSVGRSAFEIRLAQLLNAILYLGISPAGFTGAFNASNSQQMLDTISLTATTAVQQDTTSCNRAWLGVLIVASLITFVCALMGAVLRMLTLAPDVLGSVSVTLLHNKIEGVNGSSTWSSDVWARNLKKAQLRLGDVEPWAEVGRIALTTSVNGDWVSPVNKERYYI